MEIARINKSVVKVVQLKHDESGKLAPIVLYEKPNKKKKISGPLKPLEKGLVRLAKAQVAFANKYLEGHQRSNEKNRNGFLRDMPSNIVDAETVARRKLGVKRMMP